LTARRTDAAAGRFGIPHSIRRINLAASSRPSMQPTAVGRISAAL
jgi:hypothetical protein